ncbi:Ig-like domain-containing protein [Nocardioides KLBMP 9356]|uniref:Ig-like domain-containing protein n=1 Tax=Nocardioides potassii TaxID=2911371 RepID=A0ABS9HGH8_9ACTN|nr:Ig-like domain-containing protein [Nocardioides potassii]MCF6379659.1 Ig-like domain-containing protein [Nocardioides potassii]
MNLAPAVASLLVLAGGGWAAPAHAAPPSTTTVTLTATTSAYGDTVRATAQVDAGGALVDGDIYFVLDGTSYKTNATPSGSQTFVLPTTAAVGDHSVSARFVPRLPNQSPSESAPATWVVTRARTLVQLRVTGRGARIPTAVVVGALGDFGTVPTGAVGVTVRHLGTGRVVRREKALDTTGAATARLGVLRTGRYRVRVTYAGDAQHLAAKRSSTFSVRQR